MKVLFSIFLAVFLSKGCAKEQDLKDLKDVKIIYEATTRGAHKLIKIEKNCRFVCKN